jgi:alkylresorcinol/alkylpyrone synthase
MVTPVRREEWSDVNITGVGVAFPPHYYEQDELLAAFSQRWEGAHFNTARLERLHQSVMVGGRHLALSIDEYDQLVDFGAANDAWIRVATDVGEAAVRDALAVSCVPIERVGAFFSTTVTGVAVPSLDALLMNRLDLPVSTKRTPIFGLGCLAGAAGVARAADYVRAYPGEAALLLSVELCSLTVQRNDFSIANLISTGLFGDGAACVVLVGAELADELGNAPAMTCAPRVLATEALFFHDTERVMGWDVSGSGLKVVLSADVPRLAREELSDGIRSFLGRHCHTPADIDHWVCHPGGPKVLTSLQDGLGLSDDPFALTWQSLREVGNLSSASVLLVLRGTMSAGAADPGGAPEPGHHGLMVAMGPGFCAEMLLLEWV